MAIYLDNCSVADGCTMSESFLSSCILYHCNLSILNLFEVVKWFVLLCRFYLHVDAGHIHYVLIFLSIYMPSLNFPSHFNGVCIHVYHYILFDFYMVGTCSFLI